MGHAPTIDPGEAEHNAPGGAKRSRAGVRSVKRGTPSAAALPVGRADSGRDVINVIQAYGDRVVVEAAKVHTWLSTALNRAFVEENVVFRENTHERSIVFHVARHLAALVEADEPDYCVDVDYDRWHVHRLGSIKKRLYGLRDDDGNKIDFGTDVYPDLIVHRRSGPSKDHNILVAEAKKRPGAHKRDRLKLELFQAQLHYQHAVMIILGDGITPPQCDWLPQPELEIEILD